MARKRVRIKSAAKEREKAANLKTSIAVGLVLIVLLAVVVAYIMVSMSQRTLDKITLCPDQLDDVTVLMVDVTDPLTLPQTQDLLNQLERLKNQIPRYGQLSVMRVDATSARLLTPIITRCNPGTANDVTAWTADPKAVQDLHNAQFDKPLDEAFAKIANATGSSRSPIFESVQSAALTELQRPELENAQKRLIIVSDLLQNTESISFYNGLPNAQGLLKSQEFQSVRTDLRDVQVELWMLLRMDGAHQQPRQLIKLWEQILREQGATVTRAYNVSG